MKKLEVKQKMFCQEYLLDLNATRAAARAGYSKKTVNVKGHQLLSKPHIQKHIQELMDKRSKETGIEANRVVAELAKLAFSDLTDIVKVDGNVITLKSIDVLTPAQRASISEISNTNAGLRVKMHSKIQALELLGKHLKLFTERHEHLGENSRPVPITVVKEYVKEEVGVKIA